MIKKITYTALILVLALQLSTITHANSKQPISIKALSPKDSLATMVLQDGFTMELVASEPMIEEPVLLSFDGNGRMYVAEMLTYMQNAEGHGQMEAISRIKRLEDTNNDGIADKVTIFADKLLLPRMILPLQDGKILVRETNTHDLLLLEDVDGDGIAEKRSTLYEGGPRGGNLEHQPSGLIWGIDNWLYVTVTNKRYRINDNKIISQNIRYGGGQWGLGQDETGRLYYSSAGGEKALFSFQYPIVYGTIPIEGSIEEGFSEVFPIETIPDVQGGKARLREDNTLNHITGIAGQSVYLGDKLPELYGNYIAPEPVGNLIRRAKNTRQYGYSFISHPYQNAQKEFIASTDTAFRPVWSETAPDGTLYIVDMYRGIIQESNWTPKGSFLRTIIDKFGLDKIIGGGRIYRVTKPGVERAKAPKMYAETPSELLKHLGHSNHWWRINAQKFIVLSQDRSVIPALKNMVRTHKNAFARLHALWTLEGLKVIDKSLLVTAFSDKDSNVQTAALRISEQLVSTSDKSIVETWKSLIPSADIELAQQIFLSIFYVDIPVSTRDTLSAEILAKFGTQKGLAAIHQALQYQLKEKEKEALLASENKELADAVKRGEQHFNALCSTCHGADGKGTAAGNKLIAPSFENNPRVNGDIAILGRSVLHGLSGPIDGEEYVGGMMASIASNGDQWVADVLTYIRNNFNNKAPLIRADQIRSIREMSKRNSPWTMEELNRDFGQEITNKKEWTFSASHNSHDFSSLIDGKTDWPNWNTKAPQAPGMWLQVKLPQNYQLSQIHLDSTPWNWLKAQPFKVELSLDGEKWMKIDENIQRPGLRTSNALGYITRYIRFTLLNGNPNDQWTVTELNLYGRPANP